MWITIRVREWVPFWQATSLALDRCPYSCAGGQSFNNQGQSGFRDEQTGNFL